MRNETDALRNAVLKLRNSLAAQQCNEKYTDRWKAQFRIFSPVWTDSTEKC